MLMKRRSVENVFEVVHVANLSRIFWRYLRIKIKDLIEDCKFLEIYGLRP